MGSRNGVWIMANRKRLQPPDIKPRLTQYERVKNTHAEGGETLGARID